MRIVAGDVPPALKDVQLRTLDIGLLQAGASMKGEFEQRLRQVIEEVQHRPSRSFCSLTKRTRSSARAARPAPAMPPTCSSPPWRAARCAPSPPPPGTNTKSTSKKTPRSPAAFRWSRSRSRSRTKAILMMRGIMVAAWKSIIKVQILDEAIEAAVRLSHRYIPARQLPDKAVSLIDTACARVAVSQHAVPPKWTTARRRIQALETELEILGRETSVGVDHKTRVAEINEKLAQGTRRLWPNWKNIGTRKRNWSPRFLNCAPNSAPPGRPLKRKPNEDASPTPRSTKKPRSRPEERDSAAGGIEDRAGKTQRRSRANRR